MSVAKTAIEDEQVGGEVCWCCGCTGEAGRMVHLGNHPEVALCLRCARFAAKSGREIEDLDRRGIGVEIRDRLRGVRKAVVARGWHQHPVVGRGLRWLGRRTP